MQWLACWVFIVSLLTQSNACRKGPGENLAGWLNITKTSCSWRFLPCSCSTPSGKKLYRDKIAYLFALLMVALAVAITVIGFERDTAYLNTCNLNLNIHLKHLHSVFKLGNLLTGTFVQFISILLFSLAASKWIHHCSEIKRYDSELSTPKEKVNHKYYHLHNDYLEVGYCTKIERDILKHWFVIQYTVYLMSALIWFVRIIKPIFVKDYNFDNNIFDFIHSILYIVFDSLAFLVPYLMATWLNRQHNNYHKQMMDKYLVYPVKEEDSNTHKRIFLCHPGNKISEEAHEDYDNIENEEPHAAGANYGAADVTVTVDLQNVVRDKNIDDEKMKKAYSEYFNRAMEKRIPKESEFDFIPIFCDITIPLNSQGYTFAILATLVAIVFNFITV